jgi:putative NADH-flavin reductase
MRFLILGATGGTGTRLVEQALERGHLVTALVRSAPGLTIRHERLTIQAGDPTRPEVLSRLLPGQDAVLSSLGTRDLRPTTVRADSARAAVAAMPAAGVRRLLVVSAAALFPDVGVVRLLGPLVRRVLRENMFDTSEMETVVGASPLDWTVVRPPRLTDGEGAGRYRTEVGRLPRRGLAITRADLARYLLDAAERGLHLHEVVGVSR